MGKPSVRIAGVALDASAGFSWQLVEGVQPYTTTVSVPRQSWEDSLQGLVGSEVEIEIVDADGQVVTIEGVTILYQAPSPTPARRAFVIADRRWKWRFPGVFRDYNVTRKTGDRTIADRNVPVQVSTTVDTYDFLPYSLNGDQVWTPQALLEDVLRIVHEASGDPFRIDDVPIGDSGDRRFVVQDLELRDSGDVAIARALDRIPGTGIFVDLTGTTVVFDAADLNAQDAHFEGLPSSTYDGQKAEFIDRGSIRPSSIRVHYQREVEARFQFSDSYGSTLTTTGLDPNQPYLENVVQTVDPEMTVEEFDPESRTTVTKTVPAGTWVSVEAFLNAANADPLNVSLPWNFDTISYFWFTEGGAGLSAALGAEPDKDRLQDVTAAARVATLQRHFRQTFRINRRYMERVRSLRAVRVATLDPVTGARAPAAVWGEACIVTSDKGRRLSDRISSSQKSALYVNVDYLAASNNSGVNLVATSPGPAVVSILDEELGIFRVDYQGDPGGLAQAFIPSHVASADNPSVPRVPSGDLADQELVSMGFSLAPQGTNRHTILRDNMKFEAIMTFVPAAPNTKRQFHVEEVDAGDVASNYRGEFRIRNGEGPPMDVFVAPNEVTARFAWESDLDCPSTLTRLLALDSDDPQTAGVEGPDLPGFVFANGERIIPDHAQAVAAELLAPLADGVEGTIVHAVPTRGPELVGNMTSTTIQVASAPSTKVQVISVFPPGQRPLSRLALLESATRRALLGTVTFRG